MELPKIKSPADKLRETLDSMDERQLNLPFDTILFEHIHRFPTDFNASYILHIIQTLSRALVLKVADLELIADVAEERATYLKKYLSGELYTSEEAAKAHLPIQLGHANDILLECRRRWE